MKLLIVDDNEEIRTQLKYGLAFAEDRSQAMTVFHEVKPQLIGLDVGLRPSPDTAEEGLKALDELRRLGWRPSPRSWSSSAIQVGRTRSRLCGSAPATTT